MVTPFPYRRLAYHRDGTQVFLLGKRPFVTGMERKLEVRYFPEQIGSNPLAAMNDLEGPSMQIEANRTGLLFLFPTPMRIRGVFPYIRSGSYQLGQNGPFIPRFAALQIEYSQDAKEFVDGTYVNLGIAPQLNALQIPFSGVTTLMYFSSQPLVGESGLYSVQFPIVDWPDEDEDEYIAKFSHYTPTDTSARTLLDAGTRWKELYDPVTGGVVPYDMRRVTALRVTWAGAHPVPPGYIDRGMGNGLDANLFLYGDPELESWRDYMQIQDAKHHDAVYSSELDWGASPYRSSADIGIRVKNLSPTGEARDIDLYFDLGPAFVTSALNDMFVLSLDNGKTWVQKLRLQSLGPGALSPVILIRRITTTADPLGHAQVLLRTEVGKWVSAGVQWVGPIQGTVAIVSNTQGGASIG